MLSSSSLSVSPSLYIHMLILIHIFILTLFDQAFDGSHGKAPTNDPKCLQRGSRFSVWETGLGV